MVERLLDRIAPAYDAVRHRELLAAQWEQERWFDTPRQRRSADIACAALRSAGLSDAQLISYPVDGCTRYQDWTVPMAWDCDDARLAFADTGEVLCDRRQTPTAVVYWSGPLASPAHPAAAGVIDGDAWPNLTPRDVDGRFVLTAGKPRDMKVRLLGMRPLAVISDFIGLCPQHTDDTVKWCNTWGDSQPDGWYLYACDTVLPGFCISPAAGRRLRARLAAAPGLCLAGFCDSRLYAGQSQIVTATLPGTDPSREIWLFAHAGECGANDNCSGTSSTIEALRMLAGLVAVGRLPPPRHSIRVIAMDECIGMAAFGTLRDDLRRKALAGFYLDTMAAPVSAAEPAGLRFGPWSQPSIAWPVAGQIGAALAIRTGGAYGLRPIQYVPTADDMIADPNCGIPAMWLGSDRPIGYHSNADTPAVCSTDALRYNTILAAAWAWQMATLDDEAGRALAVSAPAWIDRHVLRNNEGAPRTGDAARLARWVAGRILRDLGRWQVSRAIYEPAACRYLGPRAEPLPRLPRIGPVYRRRTWGTCRLESLPLALRQGLGCWDPAQAAGLYWTDGQRTVAAVERLIVAETARLPKAGMPRIYEAAVAGGAMTAEHL